MRWRLAVRRINSFVRRVPLQVAEQWDEYCRECPDASDPAERWERHTAMARQYLESDAIAEKPVQFLGEIQVLLGKYCVVRHEMHEPYKVSLASFCFRLPHVRF